MLLSYAKTKNFSTKADYLKPGTYASEIVEVRIPDGYDDDSAFELLYKLTDNKTGKVYDKKEKFYNDYKNPRTAKLINDFAKSGVQIKETSDFLGIKETVTLQYKVVNGRSYLNITKRTFVRK